LAPLARETVAYGGTPLPRIQEFRNSISAPYRCAYTVYARGNEVNLLVALEAPTNNYQGISSEHKVLNNVGELLFDVIDFWLVGPGCYHPCVVLDGYFPGATGTGDANGQYHDYFRSEGFTPANQYAEFETELTGATGALADIAGPVTAFGGLNGTWSANVTVDTLSYRYQWYLDGAPISGAASRSLASGPPVESGVHALMAAARMMDGIELYASKDVTVMMTADVGGPSAVSAGEQTTWTAIGNAARYPWQRASGA
jgi:hypothetical protein